MSKTEIRKIVYFDKETIRNILQEQHHGEYSKKTELNSSVQSEGKIEASVKVKLDVPFIKRLSFLFSGRISASYIFKRDKSTTITSTELSEFEIIKSQLKEIKDIQLHDIENSSTSFRVAGAYLRLIKGGVDGVDTKEFKSVIDDYDGYDTYSINQSQYVRFNNAAFVSNYKRNDLLATKMTVYCIHVGDFMKERFDFLKEMAKMERLFSQANNGEKLADIYPSKTLPKADDNKSDDKAENVSGNDTDKVQLFDVVYACIDAGKTNG